MSNEIVLENQKQGSPESQWGLTGGASSSIEGFTTDLSVDQGSTVEFKINTDANSYRIDIYRLGYYGGDGARLVDSFQHTGQIGQPNPIINLSTATIDAGNWNITDSWEIPSDAVSGVYIAKLVREDGILGESHIPFIVRDDDGASDVVFQTSDSTWQAYNTWGGASLYQNFLGTGADRAYAVSYNRPITTDGVHGVLGVEYAAIRWLEANGYDVSYISGIDTARAGSELLEHKLFLSVGHDEYWSAEQRANVEAARDAGVNLAFWSGNEVYWKTRWEPSLDSTPDNYRTMVTYKESYAQTKIDPSAEWTGTWRDALNNGGPQPENSLTGTIFVVNSNRADTINVTSDYSKLRFWANTDIADIQSGQAINLAPGTLGYEWDIDWDNGFRPAGLINLSSTTVLVDSLLAVPTQSDGQGRTTGNATHSLTLYKADSGALVFGAGTVFWAWGLDSHNPGNISADPNVQQAMVNLLAEMGIEPTTLQKWLVLGNQSTDFLAPTTEIGAVVGNPVRALDQVYVQGTAKDLGAGVVAGVELSDDQGATWHKALGTETWSYAWTPAKIGLNTLTARSVDDSLNLGQTSSPFTVFVTFDVSGFDRAYYLQQNPDVRAAGIDAYSHYLSYGAAEGRDPNPMFSSTAYLAANPDVAKSGLNPLVHFATSGWLDGRDPSPSFDVEWYLLKNPDVAAVGDNPLDHYLVYGISEGRSSHVAIGKPVNDFDAQFYYWQNPDVAAAGVDAFTHYLTFGASEGRDPNPYFDTDSYLLNNPDVLAAGMNPLEHYNLFGWMEGRNPSDSFDTSAYLVANSDVAAAGIDPLQHYMTYGIYEGRDPHSLSA